MKGDKKFAEEMRKAGIKDGMVFDIYFQGQTNLGQFNPIDGPVEYLGRVKIDDKKTRAKKAWHRRILWREPKT